MPERFGALQYDNATSSWSWQAGETGYRYGFNGKENDNEVNGNGNWQDYGMRMYRPELARFFSVDPLFRKYPELSTYQFASNVPTSAIDLDGLEAFCVQYGFRGSVPFYAGLGITASVNVGVAVGCDGSAGVYVTSSLGAQGGRGISLGFSGGINTEADGIKDLKGYGLNVGGFIGTPDPRDPSGLKFPLVQRSLELDWAMENNDESGFIGQLMDENTEYNFGFNSGLPIKGSGITAGASLYGDVSTTTFVKEFTVKNLYDAIPQLLDAFEGHLKEYGVNPSVIGYDRDAMFNSILQGAVNSGVAQPVQLPNITVHDKQVQSTDK